MAGKEKQLTEKALEGQVVDITLLDRAENEFTGVILESYTEAGAIISWSSRGINTVSLIPKNNISFLSMRVPQGSGPNETKAT